MKTLHAPAVALIQALIICALIVAPSMADNYTPGQLQIELVPGVSIETVHQRYGTSTIALLHPLYLLDLPDGADEAVLIEQMLLDPDIVEVEYAYENETPEGVRQMMVAAVGGTIEDYLDQNVAERIRLVDIHEHTLGDGILVAVLDTGVRADHPALAGAIAPGGYDFIDEDTDPSDEANGIDDDGDGLIDDGAGHGTMVAGLVHLVAPNAQILPIRILDDEGRGSTFNVARAIRYAVEQGADVINLSLGLTDHSSTIGHEISLADSFSIAMVAAAGNLGVESPQYYPASDSDVLSVAALDSLDVKADFSNWHSSVAISAPGVGIMAPFHDGGYAIGAGTSFSVPFISGQCALIRALNPHLTAEEVYDVVELGVVDIYEIPGNENYDGKLGSGRFDAWETWLNTPVAAWLEDSALQTVKVPLAAYPNPARLGQAILFVFHGSSAPAAVLADLYDASGRRIRTLHGSHESSGTTFEWDGRDARSRPAAVGTYFIRVAGTPIGDGAASARIILLDRSGR